jgi:hypothetical protein
MDTRQSFYLAPKRDDFAEPAADASCLDRDDIPYTTAANDNLRLKDRLQARCEALLRRLLGLRR